MQIPGNLNPASYLSGNFVVGDFETTNISKGDSRNKENSIVLGSWLVVRNYKVVKRLTVVGSEFEFGELVEDIEQSDFFVAHNTKFEIGWLNRCGLEAPAHLFYCTQIGEYVIAGNRPRELSLEAAGRRRKLGGKESLVSTLIKKGVCPSTIPTFILAKYCERDVDLTYKVFLAQLEELQELNLLPVVYTRNILTPVLVDIESKGVHLDKDRVLEETLKYEEQYADISRQLSEFSEGTNFNSPKQVAELLYDRLGFSELKDFRGGAIRTTSNGRKTDITTIANLKASNKRQRRFTLLYKEYSRIEAALSKNLHFFRAIVEEKKDKIFYANLNQTVTKTHRLSSTGKPVYLEAFGKEKGIQFQNIPREFKTCFSARAAGWKIGEADGGQLEFRVAAFLGQDKQAIHDIVNGVDVHAVTAQTMTEAGQETNRQEAKSRTFKPLFGGSSGTKAEQSYFKLFKEKYSGITDTQETWKDEVEKTKKLRTITGLIFYWPDTRWEGSGKHPYLRNTTSICNFPVQSFATADIIPIAVVYTWYGMKERGMESFLINTIHDSVISEVHPDETEQFEEVCKWAFEDCVYKYLDKVYGIEFNLPLSTEVKIGDVWNG